MHDRSEIIGDGGCTTMWGFFIPACVLVTLVSAVCIGMLIWTGG